MQPYRYAKPHRSGECPECEPDRPGHQMCQHDGCDNLAEAQHRRHATAAEYDALPEHFKPIDGIAHQAVYVCLDHETDPICDGADHPAPTAEADHNDLGECPVCHARPTLLCTRADGKPRSAPHPERAATPTPVIATACNHVHREDCGGQGACQCTADDPAPHREPRVVPPPAPPAPAPIHVPTHGQVAEFLADHGIDVDHVLNLELVPSADGPIVLRAVVAVIDHHGNHVFDEHGQRKAEVHEIRLTPTHSTDPVHLP